MNNTEKNKVLGGTLYIVATPIGNLADLSERARKVLSEVDFIAAEDTRVTGLLLSQYGITKPMLMYHDHNKEQKEKEILNKLQSGLSGALVSDAGTPCISDPGGELVRACIENNVPVTSVPGCCAAITALTLSGFVTGRFAFEGFLTGSRGEKRKRLEEIKLDRRTLIFYESPHRVQKTVSLFYEILGDREVALARELTKFNEQVVHTTLGRAVQFFDEHPPKGEYVLVVAGAPREKIREEAFFADMTIAEHVAFYIESGLSKMDAMKAVSRDRGIPKGAVYKEMVDR